MTVEEYINENIGKTTRISDGKDLELTVLPKPYTVPCVNGFFREMYYWDTYFTNKGLILTGNAEQAVNNLENFVFLIDKFGYIPNGTRKWLTNRSQPPFFGLAIKDAWDYLTDEQRKRFADALKKEYQFWISERSDSDGLAHYDAKADDAEYLWYTRFYEERVGIKTSATVERGRDIMAEAESGWDFCPRFLRGCTKYFAVDLNSLLYADEMLLAKIDSKNCEEWAAKAEKRKDAMLAMRGKNGIFFDYDNICSCPSNVYSCAGFFPYFAGVSLDESSFLKLLDELEYPYGVIAAKTDLNGFQWSQPNGWAPLFYVCVAAAVNVGNADAAKRISEKYVKMLNSIFEKTGALYEKYDVTAGTIGSGEYDTPEMLGWTAGVYLSLLRYLEEGKLL